MRLTSIILLHHALHKTAMLSITSHLNVPDYDIRNSFSHYRHLVEGLTTWPAMYDHWHKPKNWNWLLSKHGGNSCRHSLPTTIVVLVEH